MKNESFTGLRSRDVGAVPSRRRTSDPYRPPSKWQTPPNCHCEAPAGPWQSLEGSYVFAGSALLSTPVLRDCTPRALPRASRSGRHVASLLAMTNLGAIAFLTLARTSRRCAAGRGQPGPSKCKKPGMPDFPASPIGSLTYRTVPWRGRGGRPRSGSSAAPRGPRCRWSRRRSCRRSYPHRRAPWQPRSACRASAP